MAKASVKIEMKADKQCKGSVRYIGMGADDQVTNIYLSRKFAKDMPDNIIVTVESK